MNKKTRKLILIFLLLLLYDGVLRKWILIPLSTPIMMLKQVIAILICIMNVKLYFKMSIWEKSFILVGFVAFITSLLFGHQNIIVALYGCLPFWFGLPLCFIIGKRLCREDLIAYMRIIIYTSFVNSLLMIAQFLLPPSHILNFRGSEVDARIADLSVSELSGMFRPSGLFVHSTHSNLFMLLSLFLILYGLLFNKQLMSRFVLVIALVLSLFACVCSASRTCIMLFLGSFSYIGLYVLVTKQKKQFFKFLAVLTPIMLVLAFSPLGSKALDNIGNRFENASESQSRGKSTIEGTLYDIWNRNIVYNVEAIIDPHTLDGESIPFWGYGQGLSTQVGGKITGVGKKHSGFALAEWDGLRIMCESGYILGWLIIYVRMGYVLRFLFCLSYYKRKNFYILLCLYVPFFMSFYLLMTWGNLFMANFAFFVGGLFLASLRIDKESYKVEPKRVL